MTNSLLKKAVEDANGMLALPVYEELFRIGSESAGLDFVEIGTAHGAATISLALGVQTTGLSTRIYTVDTFGGKFSSRSLYGTPEENEQIVEKNFFDSGVAEIIEIHAGTAETFVESANCPKKVGLLMLDADGRIDRDFKAFFNRMPAGAPIVIDDTDGNIFLNTNHEGRPYIDLKHRISALLLKQYEQAGYLRRIKTIECTTFCERCDRDFDTDEFSRITLECYHQLVFSDTSEQSWKELAQWKTNADKIREALAIYNKIPNIFLRAGRRASNSLGDSGQKQQL